VSPRGPRLRFIAPLLLLALSACSTTRPAPWSTTAEPRDPGAAQLVARADDLARSGQARTALAVYERALSEHPGDPAGAGALYGLGRLQADPAGGLRNYRAAHRAFSRLLTEYPESRWEAEARAWQGLLADLLAREAETARLKDEAARLKEDSTRLRMQIEQLRRTDLDLERRR
jgi:outer membrane protein assembly factor BamD (BamD/ComL family)